MRITLSNPMLPALLAASALHGLLILVIGLWGGFHPASDTQIKEMGITVDIAIVSTDAIGTDAAESQFVSAQDDSVEPELEALKEPDPEPIPDPEPVVDSLPQAVITPPKPENKQEPKREPKPKPQPTAKSRPNAESEGGLPQNVGVPSTIARPTLAARPGADGEHAVVLHQVRPLYPPLSRRMEEQGRVVLNVLVRADGTAGQVSVKTSSGFPRLDKAATNAVERWRFEPYRIGNRATDHEYSIVVNFSLTEQ